MTLEAATTRALKALFRVMDGGASWQRAELALTLHMLEALAPRFFAEQQLAAAFDRSLAALNKVPANFGPKVNANDAMGRLDALYLRKVRGLEPRAFDPAAVERAVKRAGEESGPLWEWLMGELAVPLGIDARLTFDQRWPFARYEDRTTHLYFVTHLVMIDTAYLMKPITVVLVDELYELQQALPALIGRNALDLLGECAFCLNRAGTPTPEALEAMRAAQKSDGRFVEPGASARASAHCTAVGLLTLAGALDLGRPAP